MTETYVEKSGSLRRLGGSEKVAALLLAMGKPLAAKVLRYFDEEEIKHVARSASDLGTVPKAIVDDLVKELIKGVATGSDLQGSAGEAEQLLSGVMTPEQVAEIMSDVRGASKEAVWPRLSKIPETPVAQYLAKEHPQVAALVLSKTSPGFAAAVMEQLPGELRNELMRRMLSIKHVMDGPLRTLENTINESLLSKVTRNTGPDIHARIADIINKMKREHVDEVFQSLNQYKPKEAKKVKALLFSFDDIIKLSQDARTKLFDQVPPERTIVALKGADPQLKDLILSSIASRSRRIIEQELQSSGPAVHKDVLKARRAIADLALEMGERGTIELNPGEEEE